MSYGVISLIEVVIFLAIVVGSMLLHLRHEFRQADKIALSVIKNGLWLGGPYSDLD